MSLLESIDLQARADIEKLKQEQYAQAALIDKNQGDCCKNAEQLTAVEALHSRRLGDLEHRFVECDTKHEAHNHHRRKSDQEMSVITSTLQESLAVNKQIQETNVKNQETLTKLLATVELHAPTVERSQKSYTTIDGVKAFLLYVGCISVTYFFLQHILEVIQR